LKQAQVDRGSQCYPSPAVRDEKFCDGPLFEKELVNAVRDVAILAVLGNGWGYWFG